MKIIYFLLLLLVAGVPVVLYSQPANDNCSSATSFGVLNTPPTCPPSGTGSGMNQGTATTLAGTNMGATSSAPYPYTSPCPISINSTPKDVWYSFVATGEYSTITVSGASGTLTNPTITMWTGTCANLEGVGCSTGSGGAATLTVYQTVIGQTYYVQVAGTDSTQMGNFSISAACANNCNTCVIQSFITPSVPPLNGTYNPGQTVTFCYTVTQYQQINSNWLHGVTVTFGSGWNPASLVIDSVPPSCTATSGANWAYYPSGETSASTAPPGGIGPPWATFGPGFYYTTTSGQTTGTPPGNNYGDVEAGQGTCSPTFCITLTANATDTAGSDLSVGFYTTGDGESGSWNTAGCGQGVDSGNIFYAISSCSPPIMTTLTATCNHSDGQDTATAVGNYSPYIFHWSTGFTDTAARVSVITGLAPGLYWVTVTNSVNCVTTASDSVYSQPIPHGGPTQYVSCPSLIDSAVMAAIGAGTWSALSSNPGTTNIANVNSPTTAISGFTAFGTYRYLWTIGSCIDTVDIIVSGSPNAGPDEYTCVNGTATMAAIGTGTWAALPGNPATTTITNPTANNTTITGFTIGGTYYYVWYVGNCYDTTSVIIPNFVSTASSAADTLCKYQTTSLSSTAGPASLGPFTYSWSPAADVVSPTAANTATNPLLAPTAYILTVTSQSGCTLSDTVNVALRGSAPRIHITPSDNDVCPGATVSLNSTVLVESLVQCGIVDTLITPNTLVTGYVTSDTISTTGSGGFTSVYGSPFMGSYNSYRAQYLITAAELNAAGLSSGTITDLAFYVQTVNSTTPYDTFSVSMGCTNLDSLTAFVNNLQVVVPGITGAVPNQVTPIPGWTPINLTNYFNWDGVSNVIIQVCYTINTNFGSFDDFVSYSTTTYSGSSIIAGDDFGENIDGCSLDATADLYLINNTRPTIRFHNSVPNILSYQWTPPTTLCDTCPNTQVVVSADSATYTLTVNDNGCSNDTVVSLFINPYLGISAIPDTALCSGNDTVQLNVLLSNPPPSLCVEGYTVTSIPYATISGVTTPVPPADYTDAFGGTYATDDGTAGPYSIGFNFPFYCETFTQFYVNSNGWVTFVYPYPFANPADEYTAQTLPSADPQPQKAIELMMGQYWLADGFGNGGGSIDYFVSGTAPNRILVVQFVNMSDATLTWTTSGEMHLYEGTGVIDILLTSSNYSGTDHTTGVKDSTNLGIAAPGRNNQMYTISTPEAWRFTPQFGASVAVNGAVWSPNISLSNDTIIDPIAYPTANQTYYVTTTLVLNQFTNPSTCVVTDSLTIRHGTFSDTVTASPGTICPGDTSQLLLSSASTVTSYIWTPSQGLSDTSIAGPLASPTDTTTYYITAMNNQGCVLTQSITVNVQSAPVATLPASYTICDCNPDTVVTPTVSGGLPGYTYLWSDGSTGPTTTDTTINAERFSVTVTDANHCTAVSNVQVITMSCPRADITIIPNTDTIFLLDTATLTALAGTGSDYSYFWTTDSAFVISPGAASTGVIGLATGTYPVDLLVTDSSSGCTYTATQTINVIGFGAFAMGTAFTPNGDGMNDYFYPVLNGPNSPVKVIFFRIYDRWGQLIYDSPAPPGWDGTYVGAPQPAGAYVYFVTAQYPDPDHPGSWIQKSLEGTFMLFR